jgi:hypothetical protein
MTDFPNTIEEQFNELQRQYQHACNLLNALTEITNSQRQMIERRDHTIAELRMKLQAATDNACRCANGACGES